MGIICRVHFKGEYSSKSDEPSLRVEGDYPIEAEIYPNKETTLKLLKENLGLRFPKLQQIEELTKEQFEEYYK